MPNHVTNELTGPAPILDSLKGENIAIDFNKILPRPAIYDREPMSSVIDWARIALGVVNITTLRAATPDPLAALKAGDYGAASKRLEQGNLIRLMTEGPFPQDYNEKNFADFIACIQAIKEHGYPSWYEWDIENWGTKWNAYNTKRISPSCVRFQTAWSAPLKLMQRLAKMHPNQPFRLRWADEDFGCNVGDILLDNETVRGDRLENDTPAAHRLAMELLYSNEIPEGMIALPDGRFGYKEDDAA